MFEKKAAFDSTDSPIAFLIAKTQLLRALQLNTFQQLFLLPSLVDTPPSSLYSLNGKCHISPQKHEPHF